MVGEVRRTTGVLDARFPTSLPHIKEARLSYIIGPRDNCVFHMTTGLSMHFIRKIHLHINAISFLRNHETSRRKCVIVWFN